MLTSRGLGRVLGDLAEMGYNARWGVLGADDAGAPHRRKRIWILAYSAKLQCNGGNNNTGISPCGESFSELGNCRWKENVANANVSQCEGTRLACGINAEYAKSMQHCAWWRQDPAETPESCMGRMANGVANRVDRLKAIGNGQVPIVVALAWRILSGEIE